jgi:4-hydroxy-tetrahydrodipicolinate synthase
MQSSLIEGALTALVTPFRDDEARSIDWPALDALVDAQLAAGVDGLVPCGTTGESPTLTAAEQEEVIGHVVRRARSSGPRSGGSSGRGRPVVVAGTGTNATASTIERSRAAERAGADAVMMVVPYYSRPTQEGLFRHFVAAAASVKCPVVLYNIPSRSGVDLLPETVARICENAANVVAIKESTGNVLRAQTLVRVLGDRLTVLSGDDVLTLPMLAVGGRGLVSVTANLLPEDVVRMTRLAMDGRIVEARTIHLSLLPVHEVLFVESNPAPVKAALAMRGKMTDVVRGPLAPASTSAKEAVRAVLDAYLGARR